MDAAYEKLKHMLTTNPVLWSIMIAAGLLTAGWFLREWTLPNQLCVPLD
jgi:hypothetical protein